MVRRAPGPHFTASLSLVVASYPSVEFGGLYSKQEIVLATDFTGTAVPVAGHPGHAALLGEACPILYPTYRN